MPYPRPLRALILAILLASPSIAHSQELPPPPADRPTTAPKTPPPPPTPAEEEIDRAIDKLRAIVAVSADVELKVDMLGQVFTLKGQYFKDKGTKVKMLLTLVGLGDTNGRMLQVCDGKVFFDYREVLDSKSCDKLEIGPILKRLDSPECEPEFRKAMINRLGFAGPDALLVGLRSAIGFDQLEEATVDGRPVFIIRGNWKDRSLLTGPNQPPFPPIVPLPAYVPAQAEITIGKEDGWPYRLKLSGKPPLGPLKPAQQIREGRPEGPKMPIPKEKPSELLLTYSSVNLAPKLGPADFFFQPPPNVPRPRRHARDGRIPRTAVRRPRRRQEGRDE